MKKKYTDEEIAVHEYIREELDGGDYDRGAVETAEATANNCADFLADLTQLLVNEKILTEKQVENLVRGAY